MDTEEISAGEEDKIEDRKFVGEEEGGEWENKGAEESALAR